MWKKLEIVIKLVLVEIRIRKFGRYGFKRSWEERKWRFVSMESIFKFSCEGE